MSCLPGDWLIGGLGRMETLVNLGVQRIFFGVFVCVLVSVSLETVEGRGGNDAAAIATACVQGP